MIAVALKGLAGRKVRALLTAFAVVIGVSMVSGTFVLTDTMQKAFDGIFDASYENTDAVITGKEIVYGTTSAPVPAALLAKVRALPEVEAAGGTIGGDESSKAEIIGRDGKAARPRRRSRARARLRRGGAALQPAQAQVGRLAQGLGRGRHRRGDREGRALRASATASAVAVNGVEQHYRIAGMASYGDVESLGGATLAVFDIDTAQEVLHKQGVYDGISVAAKNGTSSAELVRAVKPLVSHELQVRDAATEAGTSSPRTPPRRSGSSATSCSASAASRCSSARS